MVQLTKKANTSRESFYVGGPCMFFLIILRLGPMEDIHLGSLGNLQSWNSQEGNICTPTVTQALG